MFPELSNSDLGLQSSRTDVPAPIGFRHIRGVPRNVHLASQSWTAARQGLTAAQRAGLHYEGKVQCRLKEWDSRYLPCPRIDFEDDGGKRFVIPDGLLSSPSRVYIFEIKSQHMPEAWWQLERLYRPVLHARRPQCPITCVEICRSYDPSMPFPAEFSLLPSVEELLADSAVAPLVVLPWKL